MYWLNSEKLGIGEIQPVEDRLNQRFGIDRINLTTFGIGDIKERYYVRFQHSDALDECNMQRRAYGLKEYGYSEFTEKAFPLSSIYSWTKGPMRYCSKDVADAAFCTLCPLPEGKTADNFSKNQTKRNLYAYGIISEGFEGNHETEQQENSDAEKTSKDSY